MSEESQPAAVPLTESVLDIEDGAGEGEDTPSHSHYHHVPAVYPHPHGDMSRDIVEILLCFVFRPVIVNKGKCYCLECSVLFRMLSTV